MAKQHIIERISQVIVLSHQVSFVITNIGSYVVGCIPDARFDDDDWRRFILAKADSVDEVEAWLCNQYR